MVRKRQTFLQNAQDLLNTPNSAYMDFAYMDFSLIWTILFRLVNDHQLNRLIDSKILANLRIMVDRDRLQNRNQGFKMTHIEAKSINIRLRYDPKWEILTILSLHIQTVHDNIISQPNADDFAQIWP